MAARHVAFGELHHDEASAAEVLTERHHVTVSGLPDGRHDAGGRRVRELGGSQQLLQVRHRSLTRATVGT